MIVIIYINPVLQVFYNLNWKATENMDQDMCSSKIPSWKMASRLSKLAQTRRY